MTTAVSPQTFAAAVQHVSDLAHAKLPPEWHSRLEMGTALVLQGLVDFEADGTCHVLSSDKKRWYLVNGACQCEAQQYHPGDYYCKHRIARGIFLKAQALMQQTAVEAPQSAQDERTTPEALGDASDDQDPAWTALATTRPQISPTEARTDEQEATRGKNTGCREQEAHVSNFALPDGKNGHGHSGLPEAPASVNTMILLEGRQVQLTLRDTDETRLLARLATVLRQYPAPLASPGKAAAPSQGHNPRCPVHPQRTMKEFPSKPGKYHCTYKDADSGIYCTERA